MVYILLGVLSLPFLIASSMTGNQDILMYGARTLRGPIHTAPYLNSLHLCADTFIFHFQKKKKGPNPWWCKYYTLFVFVVLLSNHAIFWSTFNTSAVSTDLVQRKRVQRTTMTTKLKAHTCVHTSVSTVAFSPERAPHLLTPPQTRASASTDADTRVEGNQRQCKCKQ